MASGCSGRLIQLRKVLEVWKHKWLSYGLFRATFGPHLKEVPDGRRCEDSMGIKYWVSDGAEACENSGKRMVEVSKTGSGRSHSTSERITGS
jgi:hypothetical protein